VKIRFAVLHPAQALVAGFAAVIGAGTVALLLPFSHAPGRQTSFTDALFTATSAACVTGLAVVDTATHWSRFGQLVILGLIQLGGFGVMTFASVGILVVSRRIGLRMRIFAQAGVGVLSLGDVRRILRAIVALTVIAETSATVLLTLRLWIAYDESFGSALWHGLFHSVSAWNNAGFALYSDSLTRFASDWYVSGVIGVTIIGGGLGFPVWLELWDRFQRRSARNVTLHTRLTLLSTAALLAVGTVTVLAFEWGNAATLGPLDVPGKFVAGFFQGVMPRTAGFNSVDYSQMHDATLLVTMVLMFIGAGSASTGGGIKVSTVAVIALIAWAEVRGRRDVSAFRRRIPEAAQRQAVSVAIIFSIAVFVSTLLLSGLSPHSVRDSLFESFSAVGTVGLSLGITSGLDASARLVLVLMMFLGRVGAITVGTALVLQEQRRMFRYPEERPIVG